MPDLTVLRTNIILSTNRALLGAITPHLRAIAIDYDSQKFLLRGYFDLGATEEEKEMLNAALTEITADLWQEIKEWKFEAIDRPYPSEMESLKEMVFRRYEPGK